MDCIFCKIAHRDIATPLIYEDDEVVAFNDINPKAPIHFLIIPKKHIVSLAEAGTEDAALLGKMINLVPVLAKKMGCEGGFRTVINTGRDGGQEVRICIFMCSAARSRGSNRFFRAKFANLNKLNLNL